MEIGESTQDNALLWDEIPEVNYDAYQNLSTIIPQLDKRHQLRLATNPDYQEFVKDLQEYEDSQNETQITLNETQRKSEREKKDSEKSGEQDSAQDGTNGDDGKKDKKKDLMLDETAHVLGDYILLSQK